MFISASYSKCFILPVSFHKQLDINITTTTPQQKQQQQQPRQQRNIRKVQISYGCVLSLSLFRFFCYFFFSFNLCFFALLLLLMLLLKSYPNDNITIETNLPFSVRQFFCWFVNMLTLFWTFCFIPLFLLFRFHFACVSL